MKAKISLFFAVGIVMTVTVLTTCDKNNSNDSGDLLPVLALNSSSSSSSSTSSGSSSESSCSTKSDCTAGQYCLDKKCQNYQCSNNSHCFANEICSDNKCIVPVTTECVDLGGYCLTGSSCTGGYFLWSSCGCSVASAGCCLPEGSCMGIGGVCKGTAESCPAGYSDVTSLAKDPDTDCKCCLPDSL